MAIIPAISSRSLQGSSRGFRHTTLSGFSTLTHPNGQVTGPTNWFFEAFTIGNPGENFGVASQALRTAESKRMWCLTSRMCASQGVRLTLWECLEISQRLSFGGILVATNLKHLLEAALSTKLAWKDQASGQNRYYSPCLFSDSAKRNDYLIIPKKHIFHSIL